LGLVVEFIMIYITGSGVLPTSCSSNPPTETLIETIDLPAGQYIGEVKNGKPHGKGELYYTNGERYEGEWKNGLAFRRIIF